ncbi:uncharacterized protein LOC132205299 isoform X1 [Neocloeon triangulifer]|uniref:uncharacterized protein LOC132205299 isoform X1 n=1 Tax=Neocloeon triangulifer TaxID=2078957 RepID=UPI00286F37E3|nr:uncharacterized protein LOC132205299 isoform X1 [Neocloeon triangulifer]
MAVNRSLIILCLAVVLLSVVSAWQDYDRGRRDSGKPWKQQGRFEYIGNKNDYQQNFNDNHQRGKNVYSSDGEDYNRRYHHAGDWPNQQTQGGSNYCDRYAHDPYKQAKCLAQRAPRQPAKDPRCQRYVYEEPHELALCEQRAQGPPSRFPQCQHYEYDPYKLAKCERKAQQGEQGQHRAGEPLKAPQCSRYVDDLYKLSQCEDRAQGGPTQVPHCQQYSYDPYKLAKCERKAEFWQGFAFDPAKTTTTNAACQQYSYDPYKMQKCEFKLNKLMAGHADYS